jgi:hypothetical protein
MSREEIDATATGHSDLAEALSAVTRRVCGSNKSVNLSLYNYGRMLTRAYGRLMW